MVADNFGEYASTVFDLARNGAQPSLFLAWTGPLAYTFQLYFDFSGYSDMGIGLSRLFGVRLPLKLQLAVQSNRVGLRLRRGPSRRGHGPQQPGDAISWSTQGCYIAMVSNAGGHACEPNVNCGSPPGTTNCGGGTPFGPPPVGQFQLVPPSNCGGAGQSGTGLLIPRSFGRQASAIR